MVLVGNFQRILLWGTFYSLHGLFNNILLNNSGIELYMLILPAFIHARYYIRNSISVEPQNRTCLTIVSFFDAAAAAEYNLSWTSESHEEITVRRYGNTTTHLKMMQSSNTTKLIPKRKKKDLKLHIWMLSMAVKAVLHAIILPWPQRCGRWAQEDTCYNWGTWWWHKDI